MLSLSLDMFWLDLLNMANSLIFLFNLTLLMLWFSMGNISLRLNLNLMRFNFIVLTSFFGGNFLRLDWDWGRVNFQRFRTKMFRILAFYWFGYLNLNLFFLLFRPIVIYLNLKLFLNCAISDPPLRASINSWVPAAFILFSKLNGGNFIN